MNCSALNKKKKNEACVTAQRFFYDIFCGSSGLLHKSDLHTDPKTWQCYNVTIDCHCVCFDQWIVSKSTAEDIIWVCTLQILVKRAPSSPVWTNQWRSDAKQALTLTGRGLFCMSSPRVPLSHNPSMLESSLSNMWSEPLLPAAVCTFTFQVLLLLSVTFNFTPTIRVLLH